MLVAMAECKECKRKFRLKGKTITHETPDYVRFEYPRHNSAGMIFCSKECMFIFFARDLARAIITLAKT